MNAISRNSTSTPNVLLIEDEADIRELIQELLECEGYNVCAFETADSAWAFLQQERQYISLMISDVRMPGTLNGADLANLVAQHWPTIPIILSSGYPADIQLESKCHPVFLAKPWVVSEFLQACHAALQPAAHSISSRI